MFAMTMLGEETRCPDEGQIERLLFAQDGAGEDRTAFLAHLEHCAECRLLAGVLADDAGPTNRRAGDADGPRAVRAFSDGELLDDRYEILAFVARGGMGEVYRAHDRLLGETVALKTVLCDSSAEAEALARFRAEVQLARRITHPNVCRILEFGVHERPPFGTTPFFTMPFLDGETLGRHLARCGRVPAPEVGPLVEQIAAGLDAIHRVGVIHRDLKSENVFLLAEAGATPRVILMDFGLARTVLPSVSQIFSTGAGLVGTPAYVAP
jgi:serine/threonine protein kinase